MSLLFVRMCEKGGRQMQINTAGDAVYKERGGREREGRWEGGTG